MTSGELGTTGGDSVGIQCVNRRQMTFAKAEKDIAKVLKAPNGVPYRFRIAAQCKISAALRDRIKKHVKSLGVQECDTWSGPEFEGFLRKDAESLPKRFVEGEPFPDAPEDLRNRPNPRNRLSTMRCSQHLLRFLIVPLFTHRSTRKASWAISNRPSPTPFRLWAPASGRPATGYVIDCIPSRHQLKIDALRTEIQAVDKALSRLRAKYDGMIKSGGLRRCAGDNPSGSAYFFNSMTTKNALGPWSLPMCKRSYR